jgi:hypothetical protein
MALGNFTFTTNAFRITRRAFPVAQANSVQALGAGDSGWTANDQAAQVLTDIERSIFQTNPRLSISSSDVSVAAGVRIVPLPSGVRGVSVSDLVYINPNQYGDDVRINMVATTEGQARTSYAQNDLRVLVPSFAYMDTNQQNIILEGALSQAATIRVEYQPVATVYAAADIDNAASTKYSAIPDPHINTVVYRFARELALADRDMTTVAMCESLIAAADDMLFEDIVAASRMAPRQQYHQFGFPQGRLTSLGNPNFRNSQYSRRGY